MDLSNDLISKFVKITTDNTKKETKEATLYGTTVEYNGEMFVKIDGSDLLTPVDTTSDIKEDERVTVMIKDHSAVVTGNVTSPSASNKDLSHLSQQVGVFDTVIAQKVDTVELNAQVARINELYATKASITDLEADRADIGYLKADVADIETLLNGNLTSDNILSLHLTAQNATVDDAFIKDAMIDTVTANKILSGTIDTNNVRIQSKDGSMLLQGNIIQMKDENDVVRIQIGKDNGGKFSFILYDETGAGVLIDEDGVKSSNAIADGLIVDAKVADNANISGSKLDIVSVITEVNNDNSTTIKSNKIYLDEQQQSLEVAFNSLKTEVDTIRDVTIDGDLSSVVDQVQSNTTKIEVNEERISTLVAENISRTEEISNLDGEIQEVNTTLSSKYTSMEQDLEGFKTTVNNAYATKSELNTLNTEMIETYAKKSEISQMEDSIISTVSNTYITKEQVQDMSYVNLIHNSNCKYNTDGWYTGGNDSKISTSIGDSADLPDKMVIGLDCRTGPIYMNSKKFAVSASEQYTIGVWGKVSQYNEYLKVSLMFSDNNYVDNDNYIDNDNNLILDDDLPAGTYTLKYEFEDGSYSDITSFIIDKDNIDNTYMDEFEPITFTTRDGIDKWIYKVITVTVPNGATRAFIKVEAKSTQNNTSYDGMAYFSSLMCVKGTIGSSWQPSSYDGYEILSEKFDEYSTTEQMNSAITQKANEITSSVSTLYTTKKELENYSTTSQMNSAINQKANEITLGVQTSYATKELAKAEGNVAYTNAVNESARYTDNKIQILDNSITSSVANTYATKSQVNTLNDTVLLNYAQKSEVQQTAENIKFSFLASGGYNKLRNSAFKNGTTNWNYLSWNGFAGNNGVAYGGMNVIGAGTSEWGLHNRNVLQIYATDLQVVNGDLLGVGVASDRLWGGVNWTFSCLLSSHRTNQIYLEVIEFDSNGNRMPLQNTLVLNGDKHGWNSNRENWHKVNWKFDLKNQGCANFVVQAWMGAWTGEHNSAFLWLAEPMVVLGHYDDLMYTENSDELYSGVTTIDKDGIKVTSGHMNGYTHMTDIGFFINRNGEDIFRVDPNGLYMKGDGHFTGKIETNQIINANGGLYTGQDIRGYDPTGVTGGLTVVTGTGNLAVRTENPAHHVYLQSASGEVKVTWPAAPDIFANLRAFDLLANNKVYANGVALTSNRDAKKNIEDYTESALNEICTTPIRQYHLKTDLDEELKRIGIIVQEAPLNAIDLKGECIDLYQMVTMSWKAIQELKGENDKLKDTIKILWDTIHDIRNTQKGE